jgi:DNA-binding transcriptional MerR regulator
MTTHTQFVRISELARRSGVPLATIKHYAREGLFPAATVRKSRNMAYYDAELAPRVRAIKELQATRFLPLRVIRQLLDEPRRESIEESSRAIAGTLAKLAPAERRTRRELVAAGVAAGELAYLERLGVIAAEGEGDDAAFAGDDLALLRTLGAARRAGLTAEMLPPAILAEYTRAIAALVRVEVALFESGVLPRAAGRERELAEAATVLSERLIVLLRRKMLVPMLEAAAARPRETHAPAGGGRRGTRARRKR